MNETNTAKKMPAMGFSELWQKIKQPPATNMQELKTWMFLYFREVIDRTNDNRKYCMRNSCVRQYRTHYAIDGEFMTEKGACERVAEELFFFKPYASVEVLNMDLKEEEGVNLCIELFLFVED